MAQPPSSPAELAASGHLFFLGDMEGEFVPSNSKTFKPPSMHRPREYTDKGVTIGSATYGKLLQQAPSTGSCFTCVWPHFVKAKTPTTRVKSTTKRVLEGMKADGHLAANVQVDTDTSASQLDALVDAASVCSKESRVFTPDELMETDLRSCLPSERDKLVAQINPARTNMPPPPPREPRQKRSSEQKGRTAKKPRAAHKTTTTTLTTTTLQEGERCVVSNTVTITQDYQQQEELEVEEADAPSHVEQEQPAAQELDISLNALQSFEGESIEQLQLAPRLISPKAFSSPLSSSPMRLTPRIYAPGYSQNPYQPPAPGVAGRKDVSVSPIDSPSGWMDKMPSPSMFDSPSRTPSEYGKHARRQDAPKADTTALAMMRQYIAMHETNNT